MHIKVSRNGADRIGQARQFRDGVFGADAKAPPVSKLEARLATFCLSGALFGLAMVAPASASPQTTTKVPCQSFKQLPDGKWTVVKPINIQHGKNRPAHRIDLRAYGFSNRAMPDDLYFGRWVIPEAHAANKPSVWSCLPDYEMNERARHRFDGAEIFAVEKIAVEGRQSSQSHRRCAVHNLHRVRIGSCNCVNVQMKERESIGGGPIRGQRAVSLPVSATIECLRNKQIPVHPSPSRESGNLKRCGSPGWG